jgi:hypothetical protein
MLRVEQVEHLVEEIHEGVRPVLATHLDQVLVVIADARQLEGDGSEGVEGGLWIPPRFPLTATARYQ